MKTPDRVGFPQRNLARRRFDRTAASFDGAAVVHREAGRRLLERLELFSLQPKTILDVGAATGALSVELAGRFPSATVIALDTSLVMLREAHCRTQATPRIIRVGGDAHQLPLHGRSVDLILANLTLPWCLPEIAFGELARVLAADGLTLFTTVGPDTLMELRRAWAAVDRDVHVHGFVDMHDLGDLALRAGLSEPVMDVDRIELHYAGLTELLRDLRGSGSSNAALGRRRSLTSRARAQAFRDALRALHRGGRLAVTVELIFGQAWGRGSEGTESVAGEAVRIPLEQISGALKRREGPR
ncbi:MAG TPA: methyltransferase domain-containing protein [Gammaproteobacteria bacterium]